MNMFTLTRARRTSVRVTLRQISRVGTGLLILLSANITFGEPASSAAPQISDKEAQPASKSKRKLLRVERYTEEQGEEDATREQAEWSSLLRPNEVVVGSRIILRLSKPNEPLESDQLPQSDRLPQIDKPDDSDADKRITVRFCSGKEVVQTVSWAKWKCLVKQEENTKECKAYDYTSIKLAVPSDVLDEPNKARWLSVEVLLGNDLLEGRVGLHVYPRTKFQLKTINGRGPDADPPPAVEWCEQVRVTGSGFLAPKEAIELTIYNIPFTVVELDPDGRSFVARLDPHEQYCPSKRTPKTPSSPIGERHVKLRVWGDEADLGGFDSVSVEDATQLATYQKFEAAMYALGPLALYAAILGYAGHVLRRNCTYLCAPPGGARKDKFKITQAFAALVLEPSTNTYSLSRVQFLFWLTIVLFSYDYLFWARSLYVAGDWRFYDISGSGYLLLISLGTLVSANATAKIVGPKGAGDVHPAWTDVFVHGGVISLDRVQQLAIALVTGVMFIAIVFKSAATSAKLPDIPDQLLTFMGLSSAGYIAGKFSRKPGPIVRNVDIGELFKSDDDKSAKVGDDSAAAAPKDHLRIWGSTMSKGARVLVNSFEVDQAAIKSVASADNPVEFARVLQIHIAKLPKETSGAEVKEVVVVNADAQEARWKPNPPFRIIIPPEAGNKANEQQPIVSPNPNPQKPQPQKSEPQKPKPSSQGSEAVMPKTPAPQLPESEINEGKPQDSDDA